MIFFQLLTYNALLYCACVEVAILLEEQGIGSSCQSCLPMAGNLMNGEGGSKVDKALIYRRNEAKVREILSAL